MESLTTAAEAVTSRTSSFGLAGSVAGIRTSYAHIPISRNNQQDATL